MRRWILHADCFAGNCEGCEAVIVHGDARVLIENAPSYSTIITDPIWPNHQKVFAEENAHSLLNEVLKKAPASVRRIVILMGSDSDPRFLTAVPEKFKFLKNCFLEFACPSKKGRNLYTHLSAYVFGEWPKSKPGARVIPSKITSTESSKRIRWHPTPIREMHAKWLVKWFADPGGVIDPFSGSGSISVACKAMNIPFLGIEINPEYFEKSTKRINETQSPMFVAV